MMYLHGFLDGVMVVSFVLIGFIGGCLWWGWKKGIIP